MNHPPFSYAEYRCIIKKFKSISCDFTEVKERTTFAVFRHDVEFDVEAALMMAEIDAEEGITSSFFFQVANGAYNMLSQKNASICRVIKSYGHNIGLHFHHLDIQDGNWDFVLKNLEFQKMVLSQTISSELDRFSFHRPPAWLLKNRGNLLAGLINVYGDDFFEYSQNPSEIKYLADSQHSWRYGHPLDYFPHGKFQLLIHPDEWSNEGLPLRQNFIRLINRNSKNFISTIKSECNHYEE